MHPDRSHVAAPVLPSRRALPPDVPPMRVPAKPALPQRRALLRWWRRLTTSASPATGLRLAV